METIQNWKGQSIEVARSRGGTLVVINPFDNLVTTGVPVWPPPEIFQKLYQSYQVRAFDEPSRGEVIRTLGFYTDLQSLHSEDAIIWSVFGTLAYADQKTRCAYVSSLIGLLEIPSPPVKIANIWIWRRIPHPDTLVSGGPEIDFGIQTEDVVIFGEAKWLSDVAKAQGKARDKTQITLRQEFFEKYGRQLFVGVSNYVVLGLSRLGGMLDNAVKDLGQAVLYNRDLKWKDIINSPNHQLKMELINYLQWKETNSKR